MPLRGGLKRSASFLVQRWWVFAIYAIAFAGPLLFRLTKEAAIAAGCVPSLSVTLAYLLVLVVVVPGVWLLATQWRTVEAIKPMKKPFGLPAMTVDPAIVVFAVIAILLVPPFIGTFGQESPVFATSVGTTYRVVYRVGAIVVTPLIEEVGHRWLLYRGLRPDRANRETPARRLLSVAPAVAISGTFFGLLHYLVASPARIAATILVGMILALAYEVTGKLGADSGAHPDQHAWKRVC